MQQKIVGERRSTAERADLRMLWVDDFSRPPSRDWLWVTNYNQAVAALASQDIETISLDHDLESPHYTGDWRNGRTGYDVLLWAHENLTDLPEVRIHTINANATARLSKLIKKIRSTTKNGH